LYCEIRKNVEGRCKTEANKCENEKEPISKKMLKKSKKRNFGFFLKFELTVQKL